MFLPKNPWPATASHWLYDEIMRHIEPDLMLERIPLLEKKYAEETDAEWEERRERYNRAFALYDAWHTHVAGQMTDEAHKLRRQAQAAALQQEGTERAGELSRVEQQLGSLPDA